MAITPILKVFKYSFTLKGKTGTQSFDTDPVEFIDKKMIFRSRGTFQTA